MALKVVLGYSGGLDTSVIVPWLRENYDAEVYCVAADVGQQGGLDGLADKARATGATRFFGEDLRRSFVEDFVWPTLRAGAVYGRKYLLGTSMARPLIARRMVEIAREVGADALAHGCTGKGNDQVRFELTFTALAPDLRVIAPWREWDLHSREDAFAYARARGIPLEGVDEHKLYSRDENLWHISHEGGPLENPAFEPDESIFLWTLSPELAPGTPEDVTIGFEEGVPVSVDGERLDGLSLLLRLNELGSRHGVGRADIVEDRMVGMKSRGVYETPGGTILYTALRELEQLTLDRRALALKDSLAHRYADLVYEGWWWTPEREALDAFNDVLMKHVTGEVKVRLFKGSVSVRSRTSPYSLYDAGLASFGDDGQYDHADAAGFIKLFGLPARVGGDRERAVEERRAAVRRLLEEVAGGD
ncbi:MAG: argininosuccinate synthase [Gemmatimonadetes bacterium]|nr:MAG: argininosuccinate synthase [Gemmatimonadota bacterium]